MRVVLTWLLFVCVTGVLASAAETKEVQLPAEGAVRRILSQAYDHARAGRSVLENIRSHFDNQDRRRLEGEFVRWAKSCRGIAGSAYVEMYDRRAYAGLVVIEVSGGDRSRPVFIGLTDQAKPHGLGIFVIHCPKEWRDGISYTRNPHFVPGNRILVWRAGIAPGGQVVAETPSSN